LLVSEAHWNDERRRMARSRLMVGAFSVLMLLVAVYCYSGYAMNASFSGATDLHREHFRRSAVMWLGGVALSSLASIFLAVVFWRQRQAPARGL
jgi:hypothetical protein